MTPPAIRVPKKPVSLDEVIATVAPEIRQSVAAKFDDCHLSAYFELKMAWGWHTHPQAAGVIFHRVAGEILRELRTMDAESLEAPGVALAILEEVLEQRGIDPIDRVRVPLRDIPLLRSTVAKFARENEFSVRQIVDIEKRISAPLTYTDDEGQLRERVLTGQLDALIADPARRDGAIVVDWKNTWALPPEQVDDPDDRRETAAKKGLSYHGYFQQKFYGWLVMKNYPKVNFVTLREFYPRRTKARKATMARTDLEKVEKTLSDLVLEFDRCLASGKPKRLRFPDVAPWNPSPGQHCGYCAAAHRCPIETDAREKYAITSPDRARRAVAELQVAQAVVENRREGLRPYVEIHGPVPAKFSKGRRVFGLYTQSNGRPVLRFFTPEGADRSPAREPVDRKLEDALRRAGEELRAEEGKVRV